MLPGPPETHRVLAVEKRQVLVKSSEVVMVNGKSIELEGQEGKYEVILSLVVTSVFTLSAIIDSYNLKPLIAKLPYHFHFFCFRTTY